MCLQGVVATTPSLLIVLVVAVADVRMPCFVIIVYDSSRTTTHEPTPTTQRHNKKKKRPVKHYTYLAFSLH